MVSQSLLEPMTTPIWMGFMFSLKGRLWPSQVEPGILRASLGLASGQGARHIRWLEIVGGVRICKALRAWHTAKLLENQHHTLL